MVQYLEPNIELKSNKAEPEKLQQKVLYSFKIIKDKNYN